MMKPTLASEATLVDLLERVLDKGLILDADLIIHLAGVPLIGVKLRAALAGMETMLRYGIWQDWDQAQRAAWKGQDKVLKPPLGDDERVLLDMPASLWHTEGILRSWRLGHLYVTSQRVLVYRAVCGEVLFEVEHDQVRAMDTRASGEAPAGTTRQLHLTVAPDELVCICPADVDLARDMIVQAKEILAAERRTGGDKSNYRGGDVGHEG